MTDFCKVLHFDYIAKQNPVVENVDDEEDKKLFKDDDKNDENDEDGKEFDNDDNDYDEPGSGRRFLRGCSIS